MMNSINPGGRPFMAPNLYVTPSRSFTHLHQDGHGTVDSEHLCLSRYNEVVMLCRMEEDRKKHVLNLLISGDSGYDALYGLPHGDVQVLLSYFYYNLILIFLLFSKDNVPIWLSEEAIS
jgi:hypothetical protein